MIITLTLIILGKKDSSPAIPTPKRKSDKERILDMLEENNEIKRRKLALEERRIALEEKRMKREWK